MTGASLLEQIRNTPWIADLLAQFDFDLERVINGPCEPVRLPDGGALEMIAGDAGGGAFLLADPVDGDRPVVYAGSEGEGGLIAPGLREALALVVGVSSLHNAVMWPFGDDGGERLRSWLSAADNEIRADWPELDQVRAQLAQALDLPSADSLLEAFHTWAADERYRPVTDRGDVYETMLRALG